MVTHVGPGSLCILRPSPGTRRRPCPSRLYPPDIFWPELLMPEAHPPIKERDPVPPGWSWLAFFPLARMDEGIGTLSDFFVHIIHFQCSSRLSDRGQRSSLSRPLVIFPRFLTTSERSVFSDKEISHKQLFTLYVGRLSRPQS